MSEHELLIRHARAWADKKKQPLDVDLLTDVLQLRDTHDGLAYGTWPAGSAERLILTLWPAYGSELPDPDDLGETLSTFWSFLRATGRMASASVTPAALRKEAARSLPKMAQAYENPARHSTGRVLADFGASIGLRLDGAESMDELQGRLDQVTEAWNALPEEERIRRMPDPSPPGARGQDLTKTLNAQMRQEGQWASADLDPDEVPELVPGEEHVSARLARESGFVRACLRLADWVGDGREVTSTGILRPAVAREAYQHLDLWQWERAYDLAVMDFPEEGSLSPEEDRIMAQSALQAWRSAGDCLPLDRLWFACEHTGLVQVGSRRATRDPDTPETDEDWRSLAAVLILALCLRLGEFTTEPLTGMLLLAHAEGGSVPLEEVRAWWDSRCPEPLRKSDFDWQRRLDGLLFHFDDCNLWSAGDGLLELTDLGRDFLIVYLGAVDSGMFDDDLG